jgi:LAO/AO transport system kinase
LCVVESTRKDHRTQAQQLLSLILDTRHEYAKKAGDSISTFRIGLSGPPGVGKSTFIERFGMYILSQGHRVAVLVCYGILIFIEFYYRDIIAYLYCIN